MSAEIAIRPLDAEDLDGFCALTRDFLTHAGNPIPPDEDLRRLFGTALSAARNFHVMVAEAEGALVGMVSLTFGESSYKAAPFAWCDDLFVAPSHRRRGVGLRLIEAAAELATQANCSNVLLGVGVDEADTQQVYRKLGFKDLRNKLFSLPL